jgi:uncharacterized protein YndB with AHSA1/START domain
MIRRLLRRLGLGRIASPGVDRDRFGILAAPDAIRFERRLPGSVEHVWSHLTASDLRASWLAEGSWEPWVGGRVELRFLHPDLSPLPLPGADRPGGRGGDAVVQAHVTRYDPPHHLACAWDGGCEVAIELAPAGDGTRLVLTQTGLADRAAIVRAASGWHGHLDLLADRLSGSGPEPFASAHARWKAAYERRLP